VSFRELNNTYQRDEGLSPVLGMIRVCRGLPVGQRSPLKSHRLLQQARGRCQRGAELCWSALHGGCHSPAISRMKQRPYHLRRWGEEVHRPTRPLCQTKPRKMTHTCNVRVFLATSKQSVPFMPRHQSLNFQDNR